LSKVGRPEIALLASSGVPLETFLARSPTLAAATVGRDGTIVASNAAFQRLLGPLQSIYDAVADGQRGVAAALLAVVGPSWHSFQAAINSKEAGLMDCEIAALSRDGRILVVAEPLREPAHRLNQYLLELNDELLAARRDLADTNRRLRELAELKNMFIASATHDLMTPLSSIVGYAEILLEEDLDEPARAMVSTIERSATRVVSMLDDLLGAAQVMTGELHLERVSVDLAMLLRESVETIAPAAAAAGVNVEVDGAHCVVAFVDERRVLRILDNLLSNAVKYSPAGGHVEVSCTVGDAEVAIAVADSGIGIPQDEQAKVFERGFRASSARDQGIEGTGHGLANARAFAEGHGGRLSYMSAPGVGSTFTLVLPIGAETVAA
jgi:signal transduction histidine kinase